MMKEDSFNDLENVRRYLRGNFSALLFGAAMWTIIVGIILVVSS
jgi:hypothetical protein